MSTPRSLKTRIDQFTEIMSEGEQYVDKTKSKGDKLFGSKRYNLPNVDAMRASISYSLNPSWATTGRIERGEKKPFEEGVKLILNAKFDREIKNRDGQSTILGETRKVNDNGTFIKDESNIKSWILAEASAKIGILCGHYSGNLPKDREAALDHFQNFLENLQKILAISSANLETSAVSKAKGGYGAGDLKSVQDILNKYSAMCNTELQEITSLRKKGIDIPIRETLSGERKDESPSKGDEKKPEKRRFLTAEEIAKETPAEREARYKSYEMTSDEEKAYKAHQRRIEGSTKGGFREEQAAGGERKATQAQQQNPAAELESMKMFLQDKHKWYAGYYSYSRKPLPERKEFFETLGKNIGNISSIDDVVLILTDVIQKHKQYKESAGSDKSYWEKINSYSNAQHVYGKSLHAIEHYFRKHYPDLCNKIDAQLSPKPTEGPSSSSA